MKNKLGLLGLLGIPIAILGVVGSVALAQSTTTQTAAPAVSAQTVAPTTQTADTDNIQDENGGLEKPDATVDSTAKSGSNQTDVETNDDASGAQEAPGVEQVD